MGVLKNSREPWAVLQKTQMRPSAVKGMCHRSFLKATMKSRVCVQKLPWGRLEYTGGVSWEF